MKTKIFLALAVVSLGAYSCVSPKKLQEAENKYTQLNGAYAELQGKYRDAQDAVAKQKNDGDKLAAENKAKADAVAAAKIVDAAEKSAETGQWIAITPTAGVTAAIR